MTSPFNPTRPTRPTSPQWRAVMVLAIAAVTSTTPIAHTQRPRVDVTAVAVAAPLKPGATATLTMKIAMPKDVHVQSDKPRDPLLIPTVATITAPAGFKVARIVYPEPTDFAQAGRKEPLAVFGPEFTIDVQVAVAPDVAAGNVVIPGQLRYQACNDKLCFPPARATVQWAAKVER